MLYMLGKTNKHYARYADARPHKKTKSTIKANLYIKPTIRKNPHYNPTPH